MNKPSNSIGRLLVEKRMTISVCESCTGGMLGSIITSVPGSSKYFGGGIIAYSNNVKNRVVGVKSRTLKRCGAVSAEVANEMAQGVREKFRADIGIGITGIAGPTGGSKRKPIGLVYISLSDKAQVYAKKFLFKGGRDKIRKMACQKALMLIKTYCKKNLRK